SCSKLAPVAHAFSACGAAPSADPRRHAPGMPVNDMSRLLVVEDDPDVAELLGEVLRAHGHEVRLAENGMDGLDAVALSRPDAVLLDVEMPVLDGPGMALRLFIRDCGDEEIPIVLLSGIASLDQVARRVGTPYFLPKP